MTTRKYMSEFGLNMVAGYRVLTQQDRLDDVDEMQIEPHIYFICRRPKLTIDHTSINITPEYIKCTFKRQVKDEYTNIPAKIQNDGKHKIKRLETTYPYNEFEMYDTNNNKVYYGNTSLLFALFSDHTKNNFLDLEVLYIGQSYGKDGSRTASERLKSHSTLQGIYLEAMKNSPDQEIWLVLCTFEPLLIASMDGRRKDFMTTLEEDTAHIKNVLDYKITAKQEINFTEAALIKYFQPPYNTIYKDSFPNPAHSSYSSCYEIDLNMVNVEIETGEIMTRLWSESVEPRYIHFCTFSLLL